MSNACFFILLLALSFANVTLAQQHHKLPQKVRKELNYYLKRHNVRDEGFDMVARYAAEGYSSLSTYHPKGPLLLSNYIHPRHGKQLSVDGQGRIILGTYHADTLVSAIRIDSAGVYAGMLNSHYEAEGHGAYMSADGSYYEGHWHHDSRDGFGFAVSPKYMKAGQWQQDAFLGERLTYTTERIYGIDISRYQHDQGKKKYAIDWTDLRVKYLGPLIDRRQIDGDADYPVSFVYIKSTEGVTITNQYFSSDYQNAHSHQIPVGAYHFFSTRQDPIAQAQHFLRHTRFRQGDLPPMLDIEPSDALINAMGGPEALFNAVRKWIGVVERATKTKPILYVNQRFVNKYLDLANDLKENYHFWIARYGEYKPDIHLSIWQLSPSGRVSGIRGDVDINVFNGYQGQWDEFLCNDCVP